MGVVFCALIEFQSSGVELYAQHRFYVSGDGPGRGFPRPLGLFVGTIRADLYQVCRATGKTPGRKGDRGEGTENKLRKEVRK